MTHREAEESVALSKVPSWGFEAARDPDTVQLPSLTSYPDLWTPQLQSQQAFHRCINMSISSMPPCLCNCCPPYLELLLSLSLPAQFPRTLQESVQKSVPRGYPLPPHLKPHVTRYSDSQACDLSVSSIKTSFPLIPRGLAPHSLDFSSSITCQPHHLKEALLVFPLTAVYFSLSQHISPTQECQLIRFKGFIHLPLSRPAPPTWPQCQEWYLAYGKHAVRMVE